MKSYLNNHSIRGVRNNNPINIRQSKFNDWLGKLKNPTDSAFEQFEYLAYGLRASLILLSNHHNKGSNTITKIIKKIAPPNENNTSKYIDFVASYTGLDKNEKFAFVPGYYIPLLKALVRYETGLNSRALDDYLKDDLDLAVQMYEDRTLTLDDLVEELPTIVIDVNRDPKKEKFNWFRFLFFGTSVFFFLYYLFKK